MHTSRHSVRGASECVMSSPTPVWPTRWRSSVTSPPSIWYVALLLRVECPQSHDLSRSSFYFRVDGGRCGGGSASLRRDASTTVECVADGSLRSGYSRNDHRY